MRHESERLAPAPRCSPVVPLLQCWQAVGPWSLASSSRPLDAANVRRAFRQALKGVDGIDADEWTLRELRHSFVSLLSDRASRWR